MAESSPTDEANAAQFTLIFSLGNCSDGKFDVCWWTQTLKFGGVVSKVARGTYSNSMHHDFLNVANLAEGLPVISPRPLCNKRWSRYGKLGRYFRTSSSTKRSI